MEDSTSSMLRAPRAPYRSSEFPSSPQSRQGNALEGKPVSARPLKSGRHGGQAPRSKPAAPSAFQMQASSLGDALQTAMQGLGVHAVPVERCSSDTSEGASTSSTCTPTATAVIAKVAVPNKQYKATGALVLGSRSAASNGRAASGKEAAGRTSQARRTGVEADATNMAAAAALSAIVSNPQTSETELLLTSNSQLRADKEVMSLRIRELEAEVARLQQELSAAQARCSLLKTSA